MLSDKTGNGHKSNSSTKSFEETKQQFWKRQISAKELIDLAN